MRSRTPLKRVVSVVLILAVMLPAISLVFAAAPKAVYTDQDGRPDEVDVAVGRAVGYLIRQQQPDGSIANDRRNATAMTSLSVLAMAGVGHLPTHPTPEGRAMSRALEFVLREDRQDRAGYFGGEDGSRMYGHGITMLMLAELYGMGVDDEQDALIHRRLEAAVELALRAQNVRNKSRQHDGGWRYTPSSSDSDLSVTVWLLMALRSAKNAGLDVPDSAIERAVGYLKRSFSYIRGQDGLGGFTYLPNQTASQRLVSPNSMGLLSMQVVGEYDSEMVHATARTLRQFGPDWQTNWLFYSIYYYSQGMYQYAEGMRQAGKKAEGDTWASESFAVVRDLLLQHQELEGNPRSNPHYGSWESPTGMERGAGRVYSTAMGVLSLSVKYHFLPIYQR